MDLGPLYLSDFRIDLQAPPRYPLTVLFCGNCSLVQLTETVPRDELYHERYGFKSGVNNTIRTDLQDVVSSVIPKLVPQASSWLDIACNDGTLLSFVPANVHRVGVDPVRKLARQANRYADLVVSDFYPTSLLSETSFDVITAISVFYDFDDPRVVLGEVAATLNRGGVFVVQQNYLLAMLETNAVDNICHEHLTYYSLSSMEPLLADYGLEVFDVRLSTVNGGSFRTYICHKGQHEISPTVDAVRRREDRWELRSPKPFVRFANHVTIGLRGLQGYLEGLHDAGASIYIYGASTRGNTLWQAARLRKEILPFAVDRNPEKVGKHISSLGIPIISEADARERQPDFMLVSPWFFRDEFVKREERYLRSGGQLIFPLPKLQVV